MRAVNYFLALRAFCEKHRGLGVASFHVRAGLPEVPVNKFKSSSPVIDKSKLHDTSRLRGLKGTAYKFGVSGGRGRFTNFIRNKE